MLSTTIGQQDDVVHPALQPERRAATAAGALGGGQGAEQHRIGRGERGAEDRGRGEREAEQQPGGEGDERRRKQRARARGCSAAPAGAAAGSRPSPSPMASLKSTSTRPSVAITCERGRVERERRPGRGPRARAPRRRSRKMATWGRPVRSTAPERSDETRMTMPISASVAARLSRVMAMQVWPRYWRMRRQRTANLSLPCSPTEPHATALLLATCGLLLGGQRALQPGVPAHRRADRAAVPRCIGMLAGSEGIGGIAFDDYRFAFRLGSLALALILFDGGLNTPLSAVRERPGRRPACSPRSGVALTAAPGRRAGALLGARLAARRCCSARWCRPPMRRRCSRCSAAAGSSSSAGWASRSRSSRASTIPVAVILTTALTQNLLEPGHDGGPAHRGWRSWCSSWWARVVGLAVGYGGRVLLLAGCSFRRGGLYPAMTLALALLAFGVATLLPRQRVPRGVPRRPAARQRAAALPRRTAPGARRARLARQIGMFLILGLLVFPSGLRGGRRRRVSASRCCLPFVVRPLVVVLLPAPFRYPGAGGALHRVGGAPGRGADRAGDLSRCWSARRAPSGCSTWCSSSWW